MRESAVIISTMPSAKRSCAASPVRLSERQHRDRRSNERRGVPAQRIAPSIAVLPFNNLTGDAAQDLFADGIVEEIITALSRIPSLYVVSRNSSFRYKGPPIDVREVARRISGALCSGRQRAEGGETGFASAAS